MYCRFQHQAHARTNRVGGSWGTKLDLGLEGGGHVPSAMGRKIGVCAMAVPTVIHVAGSQSSGSRKFVACDVGRVTGLIMQ